MPVSTVTLSQIGDKIHEYRSKTGHDPKSIGLHLLTKVNLEVSVGEVELGRAALGSNGEVKFYGIPVESPARIGRNEIRVT